MTSEPSPPLFVTDTPAFIVSPGRANCGMTGFAINGFVVKNVVSALPKRASVVNASAITRQVVRSSGSVNVTLAFPLASVFSAPCNSYGLEVRANARATGSPEETAAEAEALLDRRRLR